MKIKIHKDNGVYLDFGNGIELSTVWGYCTYSDNYGMDSLFEMREGVGGADDLVEKFTKRYPSKTVEIMFLRAPKEFLAKMFRKYKIFSQNNESKAHYGYLPLEDWLDIIHYATKVKNVKKVGKIRRVRKGVLKK